MIFAEELLCKSHKSTQTTAMSDLENTLITQDLETRTTFLKRYESLKTLSTTSRVSILFSIL